MLTAVHFYLSPFTTYYKRKDIKEKLNNHCENALIF